jgi:hypothetical protein
VAVDGGEDLVGGGVDRAFRQELENGVALRGGAQTGRVEGLAKLRSQLRHGLNLEYINA